MIAEGRQNLCQHFGICGGCTQLKTLYATQLKNKETKLRNLFKKYTDTKIHPILASPHEFDYRFKVQMPFGRRSIGHKTLLTLGIHNVDNKFIVDQAECKIQDPGLTKVAQAIRLWARKEKLSPYNEKSGNGDLRHIVLRKSLATGEILVGIVTSDWELARKKDISKSLFNHLRDAIGKKGAYGKLVGIVQNVNSKNTNMVLGKETNLLWGRPYIFDKIGNFKFKVNLHTFIQVNPYQTPTLYNLVRENIPEKSRVVDAFAGMGTIGIWISQQAHSVVCLEENADSFRSGLEAIRTNNIKNVKFRKGRTEDTLPEILARGDADVLVLDPPRVGMQDQAIRGIVGSPPPRIIYVSCDPVTMHRDISHLNKTYHLTDLHPVDLFPQTDHLETVAVLVRR